MVAVLRAGTKGGWAKGRGGWGEDLKARGKDQCEEEGGGGPPGEREGKGRGVASPGTERRTFVYAPPKV